MMNAKVVPTLCELPSPQPSHQYRFAFGRPVEHCRVSSLPAHVVRSFAWLEKCRRLWKNCERKLKTSLQMIHLAFLGFLLRRS